MIYVYSMMQQWIVSLFMGFSLRRYSKDIHANNRTIISEYRNLRERMENLSPFITDHLRELGDDERLEASKLYAHLYDSIAYQFFDFTDYVQTDSKEMMTFQYKGASIDDFKAELLHLECTYSPLASPSIH